MAGVRWAACPRRSSQSICLGVLIKTGFKVAFSGHASVRGFVHGASSCVSSTVRETTCRADRYLLTPKPNLCDLIAALSCVGFPRNGICSAGIWREPCRNGQMGSERHGEVADA